MKVEVEGGGWEEERIEKKEMKQGRGIAGGGRVE